MLVLPDQMEFNPKPEPLNDNSFLIAWFEKDGAIFSSFVSDESSL
jgi:hypothetical protein